MKNTFLTTCFCEMKSAFLLIAIFLITSSPAVSYAQSHPAMDVTGQQLEGVYQIDSIGDDGFEFFLKGTPNHLCGGPFYRVQSPTVAIGNRKFAIALSALMGGATFEFHQTGHCAGSRMLVSWVRVRTP